MREFRTPFNSAFFDSAAAMVHTYASGRPRHVELPPPGGGGVRSLPPLRGAGLHLRVCAVNGSGAAINGTTEDSRESRLSGRGRCDAEGGRRAPSGCSYLDKHVDSHSASGVGHQSSGQRTFRRSCALSTNAQ